MERREFLVRSCAAGVASLGGGALLAQASSSEAQRQPGENEVAYRARVAQSQARAPSEAGVPVRQAGEGEVAYRARVDALRKQQQAQLATLQVQQPAARGQLYELRRYEIEAEAQKAGFDKFMSEAALPALNRHGVAPVGVFYPQEGLSPIYVLLPHSSFLSVLTLTSMMNEDKEFLEKGADFVNAPADKPAYKSMEVQLMVAFEGMPKLEKPTDAPTRIFQLRTYESPSVKAGLKKIEMFNTAEIAIFRKVGLHPVFFGQTVAGVKMPNLTYMLGFKDMEESKANWKKFGADPDWKKLSTMLEYMDKVIIRNKGITNLYLKPASYSQI